VRQQCALSDFAVVHWSIAVVLEPLHCLLAQRHGRMPRDADLVELVGDRVELAVVVARDVLDAEATECHVSRQS